MLKVAVIPAYEPDENMLPLLVEARQNGLELIVVDDGSGTNYADIFKQAEMYAHVISYEQNHGKGYALKQAYAYIEKHYSGKYIIVVLDCDGQHRIPDVMQVCEAARQSDVALCLGSRKQSQKSPLKSRFGNAITRMVYRLTTGLAVYDTQTGLRAFPSDYLPEMLQIPGNRYEYEMNVLLQFAKEKRKIIEVPIATIYMDNNANTHFHAMRDSFRIYKEILKFSASSMISFCIDYGVYSVLTALKGGTAILFANVLARIVSGTVNFLINRHLVFESEENVWRSAGKYVLLATVILFANTVVLYVFTTCVGINPYVAKILTELLLFLVSFLVQHKIVY